MSLPEDTTLGEQFSASSMFVYELTDEYLNSFDHGAISNQAHKAITHYRNHHGEFLPHGEDPSPEMVNDGNIVKLWALNYGTRQELVTNDEYRRLRD